MSLFNPSQVSFAGGEISPRLRGRVDADLYKRSLALCENFIPLPHGPARMRAGSKAAGGAPADRLIPFNVSNGEPYGLLLTNLELAIRDHDGLAVGIYANLVTNGTFDAGVGADWSVFLGWTWDPGGFMTYTAAGRTESQQVAWITGHTFTVRYRGRGTAGATIRVRACEQVGFINALDVTDTLTEQWQTFTHTFTVTLAGTLGGGQLFSFETGGTGTSWSIDDVFVTDDHDGFVAIPPADHLDAPWTTAQLETVQFDQDLTKNRMMLVHGECAPQLLTLNVHGLFELRAAEFTGIPAGWKGTNYPSVIDWGFQGRLWLGAAPDEPNTFLGSKSGYPFDFTIGTNPDDGLSFNASVRGAVRWMQGQKMLLLGAERAEQSASGSGTVIAPGNISVEDESAFGSAAIQAAHLGDEVVFVARNLRDIRALTFDGQVKNGWVSKAISFVAEHLVVGVKELHYAAAPDPMIILVLNDGSVVACVYSRAEQVAGWWRIDLGGTVGTACVIETTAGCELWAEVARTSGTGVEIMPLHETGVVYLDGSVTGVVDGAGALQGLSSLVGIPATVVVGGVLFPGQYTAVDAMDESFVHYYYVELGVEHAGKTATIGFPYMATMATLPLEGGLQRGSSQAAKRRRTKVRLRLNDSALPLVNGKRAAERAPADPMDTGTDLVTGDVDCNILGWEEDGALTITQDVPFRTEILAIFGSGIASEV